jgi:hypothetical protein
VCHYLGEEFLESPMHIELSSEDLRRMPSDLSASLVNWLQCERLRSTVTAKNFQHEGKTEQLNLPLARSSSNGRSTDDSPTQSQTLVANGYGACHIRLTQLFAAGITKPGMPVRVRLKKELAKKHGYDYVAKDLRISDRGTVVHCGEEFDKPSPLAGKVNGSTANGWDYIQVFKNGQWIDLKELREIWRRV